IKTSTPLPGLISPNHATTIVEGLTPSAVLAEARSQPATGSIGAARGTDLKRGASFGCAASIAARFAGSGTIAAELVCASRDTRHRPAGPNVVNSCSVLTTGNPSDRRSSVGTRSTAGIRP